MVLSNTAIKAVAVKLTLLFVTVGLSLRHESDARSLAVLLDGKSILNPLGREHYDFPQFLHDKQKALKQQAQPQKLPSQINYKQSQQNSKQPVAHQDELNRTLSLQRHANLIKRINTTTSLDTYPATEASLHRALLSLQNPSLLGGDIVVKQAGTSVRKASVKYERSVWLSPVSLWPDGVIFYELHPSVGHLKELIWKVMQQFHDATCIRFMPRKNNEPDFLHIMSVTGCYSYIGRLGGEQNLSLSDGCEYKGTIAHELLHAVGFYHHQNRSDRDDYLEILWENIDEDKRDQFDKIIPQENMWFNEFDYDSIMLYGPHTFGRTLDKVTMTPKRPGVVMLEVAEKQGLSVLDVDSVNRLYKCKPYDKVN